MKKMIYALALCALVYGQNQSKSAVTKTVIIPFQIQIGIYVPKTYLIRVIN